MKKAIALAVCMVLIPFTAFSLEMVSDEEMDNVTGQSGVAITVDDVVIHESGMDETWYQNKWASEDGTETGASAIGMVDPKNRESMMFVNAIVVDPSGHTDDNTVTQVGDYDLLGTYADLESLHLTATGDDYAHDASPLTIRVSNTEVVEGSAFDASLSNKYPNNYEGIDAVVIGLPTVEIYNEGTDAMEILMTGEDNPVTGVTYDETTGFSNAHSFGTLYTGGGSSMAILDGQVEIAPLSAVAQFD